MVGERRDSPSVETVNTKHDAASHEKCSCKREIYDANALYDAYKRAKQGSDWKPQTQCFEMNHLTEIAQLQQELKERSFRFRPDSEFIINERGKKRVIHGEQTRDRVVKHSLCDEVLNPATQKYLIYDNGASQVGKGISFTRNRLICHLQRFYRQHGNNQGYILLIDFSKYYDNIRHDELLKLFGKYVDDDMAMWLLAESIKKSEVDVSYMTDEEFQWCMESVFNSLEYEKRPHSERTGEKIMKKHLNIGDQVAQTAGIAYPIAIDNYVKIVRGVRFYARYMDDCYVIHESREFLRNLLGHILLIANDLGITVNMRKTRICKLSDMWRFLQTQYALTDTGRIIQKINPKRLTCMRRKMKRLAPKMTEKDFTDWYRAWFQNYRKVMSKRQRLNMDTLFNKLKEVTIHVHDQTE